MKNILLLLTLLVSFTGFSQEISRVKGRFYITEPQPLVSTMKTRQISSREAREMMSSNFEAHQLFKSSKSKGSTGGLLIALGTAAIVGDLVKGLVSDEKYPSAITYIGAGVLLVSIPVLIGKNKKMDKAIDLYNKSLTTTGYNDTDFELNIVATQNGCGLQLKF